MNITEIRKMIGHGRTVQPAFSYELERTPQGKVTRKIEHTPYGKREYRYSYDESGHLTEVYCGGKLLEKYSYNDIGQRVSAWVAHQNREIQYIYGYDGALIAVDDARLGWTRSGQLESVTTHASRTEYRYGDDSRLDAAYLSDGTVVQYQYGSGLMPERVLADYEPVFEYSWSNDILLQRCIDVADKVGYEFSYREGRFPYSVTVTGPADMLQRLTGRYAQSLELRLLGDQVDSVRALVAPDGSLVRYLEYDAFGNLICDTRPDWQFPLGFACGLDDLFTGFVRFGYRDYDPWVGRFTCKDPLGDTGGDHDLWDYCVDDPVSMNDPTGLIAPFLLLAMGAAGALSLGLTGSYGAASITDGLKTRRTGRESNEAWDAVTKVAPEVYKAHSKAFLPGKVVVGAVAGVPSWMRASQVALEILTNGRGDSFDPEKYKK